MVQLKPEIYIQGKKYELKGIYKERWKAHEQGQKIKKRNKRKKYFILEVKEGRITPNINYSLYTKKTKWEKQRCS